MADHIHIIQGKQHISVDPTLTKKLQKDLENPEKFAAFSANPKEEAAKYGLIIDPKSAEKLKSALTKAGSLEKLKKGGTDARPAAFVIAVAQGAFAVANTQIAAVV